MHYCYLIETEYDPSDNLETMVDDVLFDFYYEHNPEYISYDWYSIGGRWDNEIPNNCCLGSDLGDFEPWGLVTCDGAVIDKDWRLPDDGFWERYDEMDEEERVREVGLREEEAKQRFYAEYRIYPDYWYTLVDIHS